MFEAIIAKIANTARDVVRTIGATANRRFWLLPVVIAAMFILW